MKKENFSISEEELASLMKQYPNMGKNSDVGKLAVEIAKMFLKHKHENITLSTTANIDLSACIDGETYEYEIKGTTDKDIAWSKLKVSSKNCYDKLVEGMPLIRITNLGKTDMIIYTLMFEEDFVLKPEDRWAVLPIKKTVDDKIASKNPSINEVRDYIKECIEGAREAGLKELILQSGDIHKNLKMDQALPTVCNAMKTLGEEYPYVIVSQPLKGNGTKLFIKYKLS